MKVDIAGLIVNVVMGDIRASPGLPINPPRKVLSVACVGNAIPDLLGPVLIDYMSAFIPQLMNIGQLLTLNTFT